MFRRTHRRVATWLLLVAYLAAGSLSGLFHDHAGVPWSDESHACGHAAPGHVCQTLAHDGDDHALAAGDAPRPHGDSHDDDCVVCRFVSQRTLPPQAPTLVGLCGYVSQLTIRTASHPTVEPSRTTHSRAPPLVA